MHRRRAFVLDKTWDEGRRLLALMTLYQDFSDAFACVKNASRVLCCPSQPLSVASWKLCQRIPHGLCLRMALVLLLNLRPIRQSSRAGCGQQA